MSILQTKVAERIIVLEGWRAAGLALVAGALSALSLAPYHISPILLFTFPVLVWLLDGAVAPAGSSGFLKRSWPAFKTGWLFGFGYFLAGFWWVGKAFLVDAEEFVYLLPVAIIALPAGLALFWGAATTLARLTWDNSWVRLIGLACSLALFEWIRGTVLTGLPWNNIGYGLMPMPMLMQTSALIGLYGVAFFTVAIAVMFGVGLAENKRLTWLAVVLLIAHAGYGFFTLAGAEKEFVPDIKLRIVQPNIKQSEKWEEANEAEIMQRYLDLSNKNAGPQAAAATAFTHIIWPESAFPFILTERRDQLAAIGELLPPSTTLITGAMRLEQATGGDEQQRVFNSLYVINGNGEIIEARDKVKLVPFGEYLPFQDLLESLGLQQLTQVRGGFTAATSRQTISLDSAPPFLPLICYEVIYSGAIGADGDKPQWIVNLTNDAWFGISAGPYQHAHQAQVRAVEEGLPVIRAANSGVSMVIDANGRIQESLDLEQQGVVDANLPIAGPETLLSRFGNMYVVIFICVFFLVLLLIRSTNHKNLEAGG